MDIKELTRPLYAHAGGRNGPYYETTVGKEAADEIERLRAALKLHDALARLDEQSGDELLWTDNYREACEATRSALEQKPST